MRGRSDKAGPSEYVIVNRDRRFEGQRLAVFIPSLAGAGAERVVVNLLPGFVQAGLKVDLLIVRPGGALEDEVPTGVRTVVLSGKRLLAAMPSLIGYLRHRQPAALLVHLDFANLIALWSRTISRVDTRVVVTVHNTMSKVSARGSLKDRILPFLAGKFYPQADVVVGVSKGVVSDLRDMTGLNARETQVIYNPIVSKDLLKSADREQRGRKKPNVGWPDPTENRLVLGVGRLTRQKNFAMLIRAFGRVVRTEPSARLVILGEGPQREKLEELVEEIGLGNMVQMRGFVDNPAPWFQAASVFALSSEWEGLPTVLIEALAFGCPVVSTRCPSGPEEILKNGTYGRLVPPGDEAALADGILEALRDPPAGDRLRQRAREFGVDRAVDEYLEVLFPDAIE